MTERLRKSIDDFIAGGFEGFSVESILHHDPYEEYGKDIGDDPVVGMYIDMDEKKICPFVYLIGRGHDNLLYGMLTSHAYRNNCEHIYVLVRDTRESEPLER